MNDRFYIFMHSVDDELLEEAQKPMPRRHFNSFAACLALCLCLTAYSYVFFIPHAQKSADQEFHNESAVSHLPNDPAQNPGSTHTEETHAEEANALLPLPESAKLISITEYDNETTAVFTLHDCDFSLSVSFNDQIAEDTSRDLRIDSDGVLWKVSQKGLIVWHMEDGARFAFSFSEDEGDAAYNVLSEIAQNLHIDLPKEVADVFCVK